MELHCNNKPHHICCVQGQGVMKHGARGKKQTLKSASTDLGTTDVGKLEVPSSNRITTSSSYHCIPLHITVFHQVYKVFCTAICEKCMVSSQHDINYESLDLVFKIENIENKIKAALIKQKLTCLIKVSML